MINRLEAVASKSDAEEKLLRHLQRNSKPNPSAGTTNYLNQIIAKLGKKQNPPICHPNYDDGKDVHPQSLLMS